ncbi:MAG: MFS transporter [Actinobacteria bacterium]|nr:MFS transporter [Actinomycetota bacterium]
MRRDSRGTAIEANAVVVEARQSAPLHRNGSFLLLWAGQFVSQIGDRLAALAFPVLVYRSTGSNLGTGAVFALYTLPYVLFGASAGVVVDRLDKRRLMIAVDILRAALIVAVPFVATRSLPAVFALSFATATAGVFFDPARLAILPEIVPQGRLLRANSLVSTGENLTEILGWAFAGLLVASLSTEVAFQLDAVTFGVSAVALVFMRYREPARASVGRLSRGFGHELAEGFALLRRDRRLLANTLMIVVCTAGLGAVYPLTFFFAVQVLDGGPGVFGALEAIVGAGFFVGSLALVAFAPRVRKGPLMIGGLAVMGGCIALVATTWSIWSAAVPLALFGIANAVALIAVDTYLQEIVPHGIRGRVLGTRFTITQGMYALSVLVGSALAALVDVRALLVGAGALVALSALVGLLFREVRSS